MQPIVADMAGRRSVLRPGGVIRTGDTRREEIVTIERDENTPTSGFAGIVPGPIHQALDRVTVLTIQVQQLRRRLSVASDESIDAVESTLESIEGELHGLSGILTAIRDQA